MVELPLAIPLTNGQQTGRNSLSALGMVEHEFLAEVARGDFGSQ